MKPSKQDPKDQRISFSEVQPNGQFTQKSFTCSKKVLQWHMESMKNNPYVKDVKVN